MLLPCQFIQMNTKLMAENPERKMATWLVLVSGILCADKALKSLT